MSWCFVWFYMPIRNVLLSEIQNEAVSFQVSSTTGLILRSQTCVQVESRRTKVPQCMWRDKRWTWPGAYPSGSNTLITHPHKLFIFACKILVSSTDTGRRTSASTWRMGIVFTAGSSTTMGQAWSMGKPQTTLCQDFLRPLPKLGY